MTEDRVIPGGSCVAHLVVELEEGRQGAGAASHLKECGGVLLERSSQCRCSVPQLFTAFMGVLLELT